MAWEQTIDPEDAGLIWHYTTAAAYPDILRSRELWLSDATHLNDTSELAAASLALLGLPSAAGAPLRGVNPRELEPVLRKRFAEQARGLQDRKHQVYVGSLSTNGDLLPQWRDYSKAGGVALGFDKSILDRMASCVGVRLLPVRYAADPVQATRDAYGAHGNIALAIRTGKPVDLRPLYEAAAMMKHNAFRHEEEIRAIYVPNEDGSGKLPIHQRPQTGAASSASTSHVALQWDDGRQSALKKIHLAPGGLTADMAKIAQDHGYGGLPIKASTIPFRF